jgi:hypothetical protein
MSLSEAVQQAAIWREQARNLRQQSEWLCREAGELLDQANDADRQADAWQRLVDEREHELAELGGAS